MATAEPLSTPFSRLHTKKPDFKRSNGSKSNEGRRKTAAERLEADKLKYVKSAEVRQKRNTTDDNNGSLRNVQSTGSLSHHSTAAGKRKSGNDVINDAKSSRSQSSEIRTRLNRSKTDAEMASKYVDRFRTKSATEQAINSLITSSKSDRTNERSASVAEPSSRRSRSPKDSRNPKSLSSYLNKAKEGLKSVTSSFAGSGGAENSRTRQSRPAVAQSSRQRSQSAGANVQRHLNTRLAPPPQQYNSEAVAVSPRTHLKNMRKNLKKVSQTDENKNVAQSKQRGKTFTITPKQTASENRDNTSVHEPFKVPKNLSSTSFSSQRSSNHHPLSTIDNTVSSSHSRVSSTNNFLHKQEESAFSRLHVSKPLRKDEDKLHNDSTSSVIASDSNNHTLSAFERLKGSAETPNQQTTTILPSALFAPIQDTTTPHLSNAPRQRKSWSRAPGSDLKKSSNRVSFNEESLSARPESRKSFTEALEEIINPPEREDDIDTAYHSMSPDASMECKTLLATSNQQAQDRNPAATSSSSNPRGMRSKTPESSLSRTPTCDDGISFGANDVDFSAKDSDFSLFVEHSKSGKSSMTSSSQYKHSNSVNETTTEKGHIAHKTINESDSGAVPCNGNFPPTSSLAPKERKEIAPDYSISNKAEHPENLNTMKSQNTSSSTSADFNKPLTALTAADLKPRGGILVGLALKPSFSYPAGLSNYRENSKRPNNTPVSPTMSPNKQAARMTPSQGSASSTPYSSLKRTPASSLSSSLKRNRQRSKSDVSILQSELDRFFSTMGMDDSLRSPLSTAQDTLFTTAPFGSESDFSFAGASAYVRDSIDDLMEVDPAFGGLTNAPSVSIIEKRARIMNWLRSCNNKPVNTSPRSSKRTPQAPAVPPRPQQPPPIPERNPSKPPPIPPRLNSLQNKLSGATKESDV